MPASRMLQQHMQHLMHQHGNDIAPGSSLLIPEHIPEEREVEEDRLAIGEGGGEPAGNARVIEDEDRDPRGH